MHPRLIIAGLLCLVTIWGQTAQDIVGTITDQAGATVAGARVVAKHLATNETRETISDEQGDFRLIRLARVGAYEIRVEKPGFRVAVAPSVLLETGQTVRTDVSL